MEKYMKKIIASALLAISSLTYANQPKNVEVVWPFAAGSSQAVMIRNLLESANSSQTQYQFVFMNKPGAGGAIAANSVLAANNLSILASTSSFYTRPLLYKESHDVDKFAMLGQICEGAPVAIYSKKYKSLDEMKNKNVTFGIISGSMTQIFSNTLSKNVKDITVTEVPYKDTVASFADMMGNHIDVSVDLLSSTTLARMTPDTHVVGISGNQKISNYRQIKELVNLTNNYWFFAPKTLDAETRKQLNAILTSAINKRVRDDCANEYGYVNLLPYDKLESLNSNNKMFWKNMTNGMIVQ